MVCPYCLSPKTHVYNSRSSKRTNGIWRRRHCLGCNRDFTTRESIDASNVLKVLKGKKSEPFSAPILMMSLLKALDHRPRSTKEVMYLYEVIEQKLVIQASTTGQTLAPQTIVQITALILKRYDPAAYVKYISYHHQSLNASAIRKALK